MQQAKIHFEEIKKTQQTNDENGNASIIQVSNRKWSNRAH